MNNTLLQKLSLILALSCNIFSYAMEPQGTDEVGRKIQKTLDEIAQKKQAVKAQNSSKDSSRLSPAMQADNKDYFNRILPQAAFGTKEIKVGRGQSKL